MIRSLEAGDYLDSPLSCLVWQQVPPEIFLCEERTGILIHSGSVPDAAEGVQRNTGKGEFLRVI